jgi:hypothetical protein
MKTQQTTQHGGEKALLEQIADLQKQLDDCLEKTPKKTTKPIFLTASIDATLLMACAAPFMPKYTKDNKGNNISFVSKHWEWKRLQTILLEWEGLADYWPTDGFRRSIILVNYITDKLAIHDVPNLGDEKYEAASRAIGNVCCEGTKLSTTILLKEMIHKIRIGGEYAYIQEGY